MRVGAKHKWRSREQGNCQTRGGVRRPVNVAVDQRAIGGVYHIQIVNAYDSDQTMDGEIS